MFAIGLPVVLAGLSGGQKFAGWGEFKESCLRAGLVVVAFLAGLWLGIRLQ
jgi:hypothetical protein